MSLWYNRIMDKNKGCAGFTIVELSLSLVFISTLSLTVVVVLANAISSYHKSITLNQVNTVGTSLVDDIRLATQQSSPRKIENMCERVYANDLNSSGYKNCITDGGRGFVNVTRYSWVKDKGQSERSENVPMYGALCTGTYSYIWNSGYLFNTAEYENGLGNDGVTLKYNGDKEKNGFRLLKVNDPERAVCIAAVRVRNNRVESSYDKNSIPNVLNVSLKDLVRKDETINVNEEPVELLSTQEGGLVIYDLMTTVSEQAGVSKNLFYYTSFILGTTQGGMNITTNGSFCEAPSEYSGASENFDYCAINKFNFAALATGGSK